MQEYKRALRKYLKCLTVLVVFGVKLYIAVLKTSLYLNLISTGFFGGCLLSSNMRGASIYSVFWGQFISVHNIRWNLYTSDNNR